MFGVRVKLTALCVCLLSALETIHGLEQRTGVVKVSVEEGSDAILPCSLVGTNMESKLFDWRKVGEKGEGKKEVFYYDGGVHYNNGRGGQDPQFKGQVSHFQDELKHGNASILITKTKVADSGDYTCVFLEPSQSLQPIQTSHIKLVVSQTLRDRSGETKGAAPEPYVKTLDQTADGALLQCVVRGAFPKPLVQWQDRAGNILSAGEPEYTLSGGKYDVTVLINVNKTDNYRCVATQEEIKHQIFAETFVYVDDKVPEDPSRTVCEDSSSKVHIGWLFAVFFLGALSAVQLVLLLTKVISINFNKGRNWRNCCEDGPSPQNGMDMNQRRSPEGEETKQLLCKRCRGQMEPNGTAEVKVHE